MTEKNHVREVAFVETTDEAVRGNIEKAFLNNGISYLIKVDKIRNVKRGLFESQKKYAFYINRFQQEQAKVAMAERNLETEDIVYLV